MEQMYYRTDALVSPLPLLSHMQQNVVRVDNCWVLVYNKDMEKGGTSMNTENTYQSMDMTFKMVESEVFVKDNTDWIKVDDQSMLMDQMMEDCDFCDWIGLEVD